MPSFDSGSSTSVAYNATNVSWSHTLASGSGTDRVVLVAIGSQDGNPTVSSVTFDGAACTEAVQQRNTFGTYGDVSIWYILDTDLPASAGTYTVSVSWGASAQYAATTGAVCLTDASQAAPEATASSYSSWGNSSTTHSTNITTLTDGAWVVDCAIKLGAQESSPDSGQTEAFDTLSGNANSRTVCSYKEVAAAGSASMGHTTATATDWVHALVSVASASGTQTVTASADAYIEDAGGTFTRPASADAALAPRTPSDLTIEQVGVTFVKVSFTDNSGGTAQHRAYHRLDGAGTWTDDGLLWYGEVEYLFQYLDTSQTYDFAFAAVADDGVEGPVATVSQATDQGGTVATALAAAVQTEQTATCGVSAYLSSATAPTVKRVSGRIV